MPKTLRFWNGRPYTLNGYDKHDHVSLAAYSIADARRLFVELGHCDPGYTEIKKYYAETWGNDMQDVAPERGIWVVNRFVNNNKPVKLQGKNSPEQLRKRNFILAKFASTRNGVNHYYELCRFGLDSNDDNYAIFLDGILTGCDMPKEYAVNKFGNIRLRYANVADNNKTVLIAAKTPANQLYNSITDNNRSLLNDYLDDQQSYIKDLAYCENNNRDGEYHSEPNDKLYDAMQNSLIRLLNGWQRP